MSVAGDSRSSAMGFEGGVAGLGLPELIQLNAANRFTGGFRVRHEERVGLIFFRDGEVVHAEQGGIVGEQAFIEVLSWPGGRFEVEPNVLPGTRTIQKTLVHLLLDSHRILDERRAGLPAEPAPPAPAPTPVPLAPKQSSVEVARSIPEVTGAVVLTKDCRRVGKGGHDEEALAGEAGYLALAAAELGALFQAGDLKSGTVHGGRRHLLLYATRAHYLGVSASGESDPDGVDAALRAALSKGR
ncbi:MAG TPA: DUF4388 domain-containing protein [Anaeromyxobacter sp.]|nr:DUF4388 domain-containing protein [Anaeromyxobacter sp.]